MTDLVHDNTSVVSLGSSVVFVCVDSHDRDKTLYPIPQSYVFRFPETITNVMEVELVYAQYEKFGPDGYCMLVIEECAPNIVVMNSSRRANAFTVMPTMESTNEYKSDAYRSFKRFNPPLAKLDRLSISFLMASGRPARSFKEHMLRFEVRTASFRQDLIPYWRQADEMQRISKALLKLNRRIKILDNMEQLLLPRHGQQQILIQDNPKHGRKHGKKEVQEAFSSSGTAMLTAATVEDVEEFGDDDQHHQHQQDSSMSTLRKAAIGVGAAAAVAAAGYAAHRYRAHKHVQALFH
jgi:hypothetical protein